MISLIFSILLYVFAAIGFLVVGTLAFFWVTGLYLELDDRRALRKFNAQYKHLKREGGN